MAKIENDKYYTPIELANYCIDKTIEIIGEENITDILEPSCGNGSFFHHNKYVPKTGFDILPEIESTTNYSIIKSDYITFQIPYKHGRLVIGNPPYGEKLYLAQKFYRKSVEIADYISFILPISQLDNISSLYEFDLIYSDDLGKRVYSDRELHCCLNIYKRPKCGMNSKQSYKLKDITIYRQDCAGYEHKPFDIRMCYWGNGSAGKILKDSEHYSAEYKIKVNNPQLKDKIVDVLTNFDWKKYLNCIAMLKIQQHHIVQVLKKYIPEIK